MCYKEHQADSEKGKCSEQPQQRQATHGMKLYPLSAYSISLTSQYILQSSNKLRLENLRCSYDLRVDCQLAPIQTPQHNAAPWIHSRLRNSLYRVPAQPLNTNGVSFATSSSSKL